jgi:hypothetical protein
MTPHFSPDLRAALLGTPVSTPALLAAGEELTLVLRVDKLAPFRKPLPLLVKVFAWQPEGGAWVVAVAFRVTAHPRAPLEGDAYLNPRQQGDWDNLERLSRQTRFGFFFCNSTLTEAVGKAVPWTDQQQEIRALLAEMDPTVGGRLRGPYDPDFARAKELFQARFPVRDLLAEP